MGGFVCFCFLYRGNRLFFPLNCAQFNRFITYFLGARGKAFVSHHQKQKKHLLNCLIQLKQEANCSGVDF